jgi:hypothetical protein
MSSPKVESFRGSVQIAFSLAHLLEHIELSGGPVSADQYQTVVSRLKDALSASIPDAALAAVLRTYPSAAEVYENLTYATSGLSLASLESNVSSEVLTAQVLERFSRSRH